ncbi:BgTH12-01767 [Blumeria graminis f. sp. triticale]|uniref:BgTH12-01767 n=1 Tax=Blumeria graminis f. sp. triticale TaxID=1689686 RepID=A0A9W4GF52_BLUGR|nr:BgTH12-01767 [Blumeria graminis f. sp. triticale]
MCENGDSYTHSDIFSAQIPGQLPFSAVMPFFRSPVVKNSELLAPIPSEHSDKSQYPYLPIEPIFTPFYLPSYISSLPPCTSPNFLEFNQPYLQSTLPPTFPPVCPPPCPPACPPPCPSPRHTSKLSSKARYKLNIIKHRKTQDRSYWQNLVKSPHLTEEERLLVRLKGIEGLPWKDIQAKFNEKMGTYVEQAALQMRIRRLCDRMDAREIREEEKKRPCKDTRRYPSERGFKGPESHAQNPLPLLEQTFAAMPGHPMNQRFSANESRCNEDLYSNRSLNLFTLKFKPWDQQQSEYLPAPSQSQLWRNPGVEIRPGEGREESVTWKMSAPLGTYREI